MYEFCDLVLYKWNWRKVIIRWTELQNFHIDSFLQQTAFQADTALTITQ